MMLLCSAFEGADIVYACTDPLQGDSLPPASFFGVADYSRSQPVRILYGVLEMYQLMRRLRPAVVVSTGAAPGLIALLCGRLRGAKTIWVDSIANSQKMSMSGQIARKFCHVTLTQWEHLAVGNHCIYRGSVI
ncbi:MAG: hypothetical protein EOO61_13950 [Hymenobacter sp.]|nr:MAG: hypothetical protein EOO61_13950 [Hymenobacter sp.]